MLRHTTVLLLLLADALSMTLFLVKYQVQDLDDELIGLNRSVVDERETIHVLNAEWSHLNNPARLQELAIRHLGMMPVEPGQLSSLDDIPAAKSLPEQAAIEELELSNISLANRKGSQ